MHNEAAILNAQGGAKDAAVSPPGIRWWIFAFTIAFPTLRLSQLQIGWLATADELAELGSGATDVARPLTARRLLKLLGDRQCPAERDFVSLLKLRVLPAELLVVSVSDAGAALQRY